MSNIVELVQNITNRGDKFLEYNQAAPSTLDFQQECLYARQLLMGNDYLCNTAMSNQQSLVDAIYNVASTGISLNPSRAHAYLVPRKVGGNKKVCLDISYRGLLKLATDTGVTKYMKAELVYSNDDFQYNGFDQRPTLKCNPFKDRGEFIGVYAMAVLHDDSVLVENMTADQVYAIRDDSEAYKGAIKKGGWALENCVWVKYEGEMIKKTALKRAFKTLPETKGKEVLDSAVEIINEHEGIDFKAAPPKDYTELQSNAYRIAIESGDYVQLLCVREQCSIDGLNQLYELHEAPTIEKGKKGTYHKSFDEQIQTARDDRVSYLNALREACSNSDDIAMLEAVGEDLSTFTIDWYGKNLDGEQEAFFRSVLIQNDKAA